MWDTGIGTLRDWDLEGFRDWDIEGFLDIDGFGHGHGTAMDIGGLKDKITWGVMD